MLKPRVQVTLKLLAYFNTLCIKDIYKKKTNTNLPLKKKKLKALNFSIPRAQIALEILTYFDPSTPDRIQLHSVQDRTVWRKGTKISADVVANCQK